MKFNRLDHHQRFKKSLHEEEKKLGRILSHREEVDFHLKMKILFDKEEKLAIKNVASMYCKPAFNEASPSFSWKKNHHSNHH